MGFFIDGRLFSTSGIGSRWSDHGRLIHADTNGSLVVICTAHFILDDVDERFDVQIVFVQIGRFEFFVLLEVIRPVTDRIGGSQVHVPFGFERQYKPNKQQYNRVHDLDYNAQHDAKVFVVVKVEYEVVTKRQLAQTNEYELNRGDQVRTIVEAAIFFQINQRQVGQLLLAVEARLQEIELVQFEVVGRVARSGHVLLEMAA